MSDCLIVVCPTAKQRVTVEIGDENDNAPTFNPSQIYSAVIKENADTGANVIEVAATDPDSGGINHHCSEIPLICLKANACFDV